MRFAARLGSLIDSQWVSVTQDNRLRIDDLQEFVNSAEYQERFDNLDSVDFVRALLNYGFIIEDLLGTAIASSQGQLPNGIIFSHRYFTPDYLRGLSQMRQQRPDDQALTHRFRDDDTPVAPAVDSYRLRFSFSEDPNAVAPGSSDEEKSDEETTLESYTKPKFG